MEASIKWIKEYGFLAKSASGHALLMDAPVASGGKASDKQKNLMSKLAKEKVNGDCVPLMQQLHEYIKQ